MKKIGLALGGGAVLGAAHVGVLRALAEKNIKIEYVSGTSIGAVVACFYAFGKSWEEIKNITSELSWVDITSLSLSKYALLSNDKLATLVTKHIGNKNIEDANIPLSLIATDSSTGEKVVLDKGPVSAGIRASTAIPGIFTPVEIEGKLLVDGGIAENVPVNTVKQMGAEYTIAVDLNSSYEFKRPKHILDVIINSFHVLMNNAGKGETKDADLVIVPKLSSFNYAAMSQIEQLMKQGYEDGIKSLTKEI